MLINSSCGVTSGARIDETLTVPPSQSTIGEPRSAARNWFSLLTPGQWRSDMSNSFDDRNSLEVDGGHYEVFRLDRAGSSSWLPNNLKVKIRKMTVSIASTPSDLRPGHIQARVMP